MKTTQLLEFDRIIRCRKTGRYFTGRSWNRKISAAHSFPSQLEAVRTSAARELCDVDFLVLDHNTGSEMISIRLR